MKQHREIELITKTAVEAAMEFMAKEKQKQRKENYDRRLRNTKLLLKHYRSFVAHASKLQERLTPLQEAEALNELHAEQFAVESIKRSKKRTLAMVRFIQQAIELYKGSCEASGQPEDLRRYKTVEMLYISEKIYTAEKAAEFHKVDVRTIYNDVNYACKALSVLVFGVDGIQLE